MRSLLLVPLLVLILAPPAHAQAPLASPWIAAVSSPARDTLDAPQWDRWHAPASRHAQLSSSPSPHSDAVDVLGFGVLLAGLAGSYAVMPGTPAADARTAERIAWGSLALTGLLALILSGS